MKYSTSYLASRRRLTEALDFIPEAVVVVAPDGVIGAANDRAERLFGYSRGELIGSPIAPKLLHEWRKPAMASPRRSNCDESHAHEVMDCVETLACHRDGAEMTVEVSWRASSVEEGSMVVNVIRDVTARRMAESELQDSNAMLKASEQAKDRFLATLGHEMRTPLNAIICFTALILDQHDGGLSTEQARQLAIVKTCGEHLLSLSNDLLDVGQIAAGRATLHPEPLDAGEVLQELHEALRPLADVKGLAFALEVHGAPLPLDADRRALRQILLNLIGNAIKYTDRGSVTLRAARADTCLRVSVADTGVGIRDADRDKLFREFTQLGGRERRREGAGLGLHLCARIAQLMGAHIEVKSEPGRGSVFTLNLPLQMA